MKQPSVKTKVFKSYSESKLDSESKSTLEIMQGAIATFPTPVPALSVLEAAQTAFATSLPLARQGTYAAIAAKNANKAALCNVLAQLGTYVNLTANGDLEKLQLSGFPLAGQPSPIAVETPQDVQVKQGFNPGEIEVVVGIAKGARSFIFQYTTDPVTPASVWTSQGSTAKKCKFYDLTPGVKYWFRVVAIGSNDQQKVSSPVEATINFAN